MPRAPDGFHTRTGPHDPHFPQSFADFLNWHVEHDRYYRHAQIGIAPEASDFSLRASVGRPQTRPQALTLESEAEAELEVSSR